MIIVFAGGEPKWASAEYIRRVEGKRKAAGIKARLFSFATYKQYGDKVTKPYLEVWKPKA